MTAWLLPVLAGFCTGILSAWGVGGGTLLLLLMTLFFGVAQADASMRHSAASAARSSVARSTLASSP